MEVKYNVTGARRKELTAAMGEILRVQPKYLGMPSAAYDVGGFIVDKNGTVSCGDAADSEQIGNLLVRLADMGFTAEDKAAADDQTANPEDVCEEVITKDLQDTDATDTSDELAKCFQTANPDDADAEDSAEGEQGADVADTSEEETVKEEFEESAEGGHAANVGLTVAIPLEKVSVDKLTRLLDAKGNLIKKALGVEALPIKVDEEYVRFPWFSEVPDDISISAYTHLITAMCELTVNQTRVTAKQRDVENEKYAFRCFLLRLGFIGTEYKAERKVLLKNLSGSAAFKTPESDADADEDVIDVSA